MREEKTTILQEFYDNAQLNIICECHTPVNYSYDGVHENAWNSDDFFVLRYPGNWVIKYKWVGAATDNQ